MTLAEHQLQLARRQGVPLLLFMGDLDDLKQINDQFGHAEGDFALKPGRGTPSKDLPAVRCHRPHRGR